MASQPSALGCSLNLAELLVQQMSISSKPANARYCSSLLFLLLFFCSSYLFLLVLSDEDARIGVSSTSRGLPAQPHHRIGRSRASCLVIQNNTVQHAAETKHAHPSDINANLANFSAVCFQVSKPLNPQLHLHSRPSLYKLHFTKFRMLSRCLTSLRGSCSCTIRYK
jgi:hypothetical protein